MELKFDKKKGKWHEAIARVKGAINIVSDSYEVSGLQEAEIVGRDFYGDEEAKL